MDFCLWFSGGGCNFSCYEPAVHLHRPENKFCSPYIEQSMCMLVLLSIFWKNEIDGDMITLWAHFC